MARDQFILETILHTSSRSPYYSSNFEGSAGASSILGELEVNQAGAVAVQASAYTDKIRRDDDETERRIAHCRQQPSGFNKRTSQVCVLGKARPGPTKCIREALRIGLTTISGRL
jgi:hypothetical protein